MTLLMPARGRPSRVAVLNALDEAVAELRRVGGLPSPAENSAIWEGIWQEETHNSTAIEGNTLVLKEVRMLLEEGRAVGDKDLREYLEVQAYAEAARWVYEQAQPEGSWDHGRLVSLTEVREIHRLVVEPVWSHFPPDYLDPGEGPGSFRLKDILPFDNGMRPPEFTAIPPLMSDWVDLASATRPSTIHPIEHAALAHARFEQIHPFRDGNGRSGRLILNLMLVRQGYPPAIVFKRQRGKYLAALGRANVPGRSGPLADALALRTARVPHDVGPLTELIARAVKHSLDRFLLPGLAGPHRLLPLTALVRRDITATGLRRAAEKGRLSATLREGRWYSSPAAVERYLATRKPRPGAHAS
jgi:cell filamentation protein, protein adenylyltransferase